MERMLQDLRFGLRMLLKSRGFTAMAVVTLAFGIGANTAIFSVVNAILVRTLPYQKPDRLVAVLEFSSQSESLPVTLRDFRDWHNQSHAFENIAALYDSDSNLTGAVAPERVPSAVVYPSFFQVLGVKPFLGHAFLPGDDQVDREHVVILSHALWQRRFNSDQQIIGKPLALDGQIYTVVGVTGPEFKFPPAQLWIPLGVDFKPVGGESGRFLNVIARLKAGTSLPQARAEMGTIARQLQGTYPDSNTGVDVKLVPLRDSFVGDLQPALLLLMAAACFFLLIACVDVANLLLARSSFRQREVAIRSALGATRARLTRQLLTEGFLLAVVGASVGLALAWGILKFVLLGLPSDITSFWTISIDRWVIGFTVCLSILVVVLSGLAPAMKAARSNQSQYLKEGGVSSVGRLRGQRFLGGLMVFEVALALVLLISAGLMLKSYFRLIDVDPGFDPHNVLMMKLDTPETYSGQQQTVTYQELLQRIAALPGVQSVGAGSFAPNNFAVTQDLILEGQSSPPGQAPQTLVQVAFPNYFSVLHISLLKGRYFGEQDNDRAPKVVVIDQTLSRRFFPDENVLGRRIKSEGAWREIVGVVGDTKQEGMNHGMPELYLPYLQHPLGTMSLFIRTTSGPLKLLPSIRDVVQSVERDQPIYNIMPLESMLAESVSMPRLMAGLVSFFGSLGLAMAMVGVYSIATYSASQRTREIGIRMMLGARRTDVLMLLLRQVVILVLVGMATGLAAALGVTRLMSGLLYGVQSNDLLIFVTTSSALAVIAILASYIPARRATRVDPMVALRYE